ncbi:MAG: LolA family protein [Alphaproteobacteria bacterium]
MKLFFLFFILSLSQGIQAAETQDAGDAIDNPVLAWTQDSQILLKIEQNLNALKQVQATYIQLEEGKPNQTGTLYWKRPNQMHLKMSTRQYLIVKSGTAVFYDLNLGQRTYISIDDLPLSFLLQDPVVLSNRTDYTFQVAHDATRTFLRVLPQSPDQPPLYFLFDKKTLQLMGWAYVDPVGSPIRTQLTSLQQPESLDSDLFKLRQNFPGFEKR